MLDANRARLAAHGLVMIGPTGIVVSAFEGEGTSCRDVAALALTWAIGELQRELQALLQQPGGSGRVTVD